MPHDRSARSTLAEVLAALLFMAIVIPVAIEALPCHRQLAGRRSRRAQGGSRPRRGRPHPELEDLVTTNWSGGAHNGTVTEGSDSFSWTLTTQTWPQDQMELLTAEVTFQAQAHDYSVKMSTLANQQNQITPASTTTTAMR